MPSAWDQIVNAMDWGGVGEGMPEHHGREKLMDPMAAGLTGLTSLPERAFGASEQMRQGGPYDPAPAVEAAMLPMGTGAVMGVPVKGAEAVLGSGILRKQPPLIGGYHGTPTPELFDKFQQLDKPGHDIGTHFSTDPNTSNLYSTSLNRGMTIDTAAPRTYPVVGDVKNPLRYPMNPVDWRDPEMVVGSLKNFMDWGNPARTPKYMLGALERAAKDSGGWEKNFFPAVKDLGHDAVQYPHSANFPRYDSYMALDSSQVMPRFSPEAQALIAERGVKNPLKRLHWEDVKNIVGDTAHGWDELAKHYPELIPKE